MALSEDRQTPRREGRENVTPVKANATIYAGGIVSIDGGYAKAAAKEENKPAIGIALEQVTGGAADGDASVLHVRKAGKFKNAAGGDAVTAAERFTVVYVEDDETVAKTAAGRSKAGLCLDVDPDGVWVDIGRPAL